MQIFVDFESSILINSLSLEKFFIAFRNYGFSFRKYINQIVLESLPYNVDIISILKENYSKHTDEIYVMFEEENKNYAEFFINQFKEEMPNLMLLKKKNGDKLYTIESHTSDYAYVGTSIMDGMIFKNAKESSIASNVISILIHKVICNKSIDSRNNMFEGSISTFFKHFYLIIPIFAIWPSWMEVNQNIIELSKLKATYVAVLGFMGFASLFRCFVSLDRERKFFFEEQATFSDENFVYGVNSINMGVLIMFIYLSFGLISIYINVIGAFVGFLITIINLSVLYSSFFRKWTTVVLFSFFINFIFHPTFFQKFFKII